MSTAIKYSEPDNLVDEELLNDHLEALLRRVNDFVAEVANKQYVDWTVLQWSQRGPAVLFEEFKKAGAWADSLSARMLDFEQDRHGIVSAFKQLKGKYEKVAESNFQRFGKSWITAGYAYQERQVLARLDIPGLENLSRLELRIADVDGMLSIIKSKLSQLNQFKQDAKVASGLMTFGHHLGELR